jgi:hypothetical protein
MQAPAEPSEGGFVGFFVDNGTKVLKVWASLQEKNAAMAAEAATAEPAPSPAELKKGKSTKPNAKPAADEAVGAFLLGHHMIPYLVCTLRKALA